MGFCFIIILCIIACYGIRYAMEQAKKENADRERREKEAEARECQLEANKKRNGEIGNNKVAEINTIISNWWKGDKSYFADRETIHTYYSYLEVKDSIDRAIKCFQEFIKTEPLQLYDSDNFKRFLNEKSSFQIYLNNEIKTLNQIMRSYMIPVNKYGAINDDFCTKVKGLDINTADHVIQNILNVFTGNYSSEERISQLNDIDKENSAVCLWTYAMAKPFDVQKFNSAIRAYQLLHREYAVIEPFIAEIYAMLQMGSRDIAKDKVNHYIEKCIMGTFCAKESTKYVCGVCGLVYEGKRPPEFCPSCNAAGHRFTSGHRAGGVIIPGTNHRDMAYSVYNTSACTDADLELLSSSFMWMKAYDLEEIVLKFMLEKHVQMSSKLQERLHSLSNRKGAAPEEIDNRGTGGESFDISSLAWKEDDYDAFFKNLEFKEIVLTYPLAIREEDQVLSLGNGINIQNIDSIARIIVGEMQAEYGNTVNSELSILAAVSGNTEQKMQGILVKTQDCPYMSVFMYLIPIGRKLDIKFYTMFMPVGTSASSQCEQANILNRKLNPNATMWETSIKETLLFAIQKMLNSGTTTTSTVCAGTDDIEF